MAKKKAPAPAGGAKPVGAKKPFRGCTIKYPEGDEARVLAAMALLPPSHLALLVDKKWPGGKADLSVSFLDNPPQALRNKILAHMNAWGAFCSARFRETGGAGQVRIARGRGGYWSYLGTDALRIPQHQPTMNLEGFSASTPESEFRRVVRHESGHALGFPHEHARREIVERLDARKVISYFARTQGWSEQVTRAQVLTPLEEESILGTPHADEASIMTYQLGGNLTRDGRPVAGGVDFSAADREFAAKAYPPAGGPGVPPPGAPPSAVVLLDGRGAEIGRYELKGVS